MEKEEVEVKEKAKVKGVTSAISSETETCESGLPPVDTSKPVDPAISPCVACANKRDRDAKLTLGKTPCARCAKKKADEAARRAKEKSLWDWNHPCDVCSKDKKDKEELTIPTPVNATH
jgi:hypothetical protein